MPGKNPEDGRYLDIKFPEGKLPKIYDAIHIAAPDGGVLTAEVAQHLGDDTVRCIAMGPTVSTRILTVHLSSLILFLQTPVLLQETSS